MRCRRHLHASRLMSRTVVRPYQSLYIGDALYSPLLFLHIWTGMQREEEREKEERHMHKAKTQCFIGREIYKISGTSVNFEPC